MIYILDTDVFTLSERHDSPEYLCLHARVLQIDSGDKVVTSIVTYEEQTRGWLSYAARSRATSHQIKAFERLKRHLHAYMRIDVLDFDAAAGREYDRLLTLKLRLGSSDLKIAAIALANDAVLLSRNVRDFEKITNLRIEDWTKP